MLWLALRLHACLASLFAATFFAPSQQARAGNRTAVIRCFWHLLRTMRPLVFRFQTVIREELRVAAMCLEASFQVWNANSQKKSPGCSRQFFCAASDCIAILLMGVPGQLFCADRSPCVLRRFRPVRPCVDRASGVRPCRAGRLVRALRAAPY